MQNEKNTDVTVQNSQVEDETIVQNENVQDESKETETEEKLIPQNDVNNIVARETKKAQEKIFKELGFTDIKSAKDGFDELQKFKDSQKTAEQKREEELTALKNSNKELEQINANLIATNTALKLGVNSEAIDDVIILAQKDVNDDVTIEDAMKKVLEKYPQFGTQEKKEKKSKPKITAGGNHSNDDKGDVWSRLKDKYK
ncbi:hypothetical protein [Helcococcus kunzii]|uniref:hypothetical protein n=1 Tax=Helcococcus kunzii TaxID=40091 RepID=UPI00389D1728